MKYFKTSIGKYNMFAAVIKQKYFGGFAFNVLPTFKIKYIKYSTWNEFELCFELFLYCVSIVFDNYEY